MSKWCLCSRKCLTGIDFSSLCPWDSQPQIQRNHFARGECGWANWLLLPCGSPRCEEQKSRAWLGVGRPRQDWLGLHAATTSVPLTNTSLDNLTAETLGGKHQGTGQAVSPWMHAAASLKVTWKSAHWLTIFTRLNHAVYIMIRKTITNSCMQFNTLPLNIWI